VTFLRGRRSPCPCDLREEGVKAPPPVGWEVLYLATFNLCFEVFIG
jgi:hypothetical protein